MNQEGGLQRVEPDTPLLYIDQIKGDDFQIYCNRSHQCQFMDENTFRKLSKHPRVYGGILAEEMGLGIQFINNHSRKNHDDSGLDFNSQVF